MRWAIEKLTGRRHASRLVAIVLLGIIIAARLINPVSLEIFRLKALDLYQVLFAPSGHQEDVLIVDIDERSLSRLGQWPWPRTLLGDLVGRITEGGAVAIGFDILFPEHDRMSPSALAEVVAAEDKAVAERLKVLPSNDQRFSDAIAASRVVLARSGRVDSVHQPFPDIPLPSSFAMLGPETENSLETSPGLVRNVPELESAAAGLGLVSSRPDIDGVTRRIPLVSKAGGMLMPSLALEMLRVATGESTILIRGDEAGANSVVLAGMEFPTDADGKAWLRFRPHNPSIFVPAVDVLDGNLPPGAFANKLVLIGTSATGLFDLRATPLDPVMPGVEVHAQLISSMLNGGLLLRPNWSLGAEVAATVALGVLMIVLLPRLGAVLTLTVGAFVAAATLGMAWWLFAAYGLILDFAFPLFGTFVVTVLMIATGYLNEELGRRQIRAAFGQYLSPDLINQLADDPDRLVLGGETRTMTILFSDVRDFTAISETYKGSPQALTSLINRLLTPLSVAVIDHRGTIDKYMGDNVMAFWNAPLPDADHAGNACRAALDMLAALDVLNLQRRGELGPDGKPAKPLVIGIGVNTGTCVVGNMGSDMRFDYTVLGDSVNLASRLESQTKAYGVKILIGEETANSVRGRFALLPVDRIRVKGKSEPERIFTLLGDETVREEESFARLSRIHAELIESYTARKWRSVERLSTSCRKAAGPFHLEGLYELYGARARGFLKAPPPRDWDGVYVAAAK